MWAQFVRTNTIFLIAQNSLEMRSRRENVDAVSKRAVDVAVFFLVERLFSDQNV